MDLSAIDRLALSTFTPLEKQSLYQLLCGAMHVDGNRDARELAIISEVNLLVGISSADIEASRKLSESTMVSSLRNMDTLKKAYLAKFMAQIILADGRVDPKEEAFFNYIYQRLELPNPD